jgi:hypothetical protein
MNGAGSANRRWDRSQGGRRSREVSRTDPYGSYDAATALNGSPGSKNAPTSRSVARAVARCVGYRRSSRLCVDWSPVNRFPKGPRVNCLRSCTHRELRELPADRSSCSSASPNCPYPAGSRLPSRMAWTHRRWSRIGDLVPEVGWLDTFRRPTPSESAVPVRLQESGSVFASGTKTADRAVRH